LIELVMESLWTSRPRSIVIDLMMVWLFVRVVHTMNQNKSPATSGLFFRLCPRGQPAIKVNGNHTALFNSGTTHGSRSVRCHQP
jgi:hypothetical protein